jgi:ABC-type polysaccharide/polyol phosphate export permease
MMLLSGAWFSLEGAQIWVQKLALIFPLTHMVSAARAIMNEGATLAQVMPHVWVLGITSVIFIAIGAYVFKCE